MKHIKTLKLAGAAFLGFSASFPATNANADFVILDDLIVDGSACIGFDCVNGESFGFDTIRIKENNLRIKFDDTSVAASFPRNDWQLTANDSANGGQSKFSIDDISGNRTPFTVEANAPSHSLYVDDGGRVGMGTSTPSLELHMIDGDSPAVRLQQDGSAGFQPQTWDIAGNETNFFVRDVTNGSTLPIRIRPGASSSLLFLNNNDRVGMLTTSPDAPLEILANSGNIGTGNAVLKLANGDGAVAFQLDPSNDGTFWNFSAPSNASLNLSRSGTGSTEFSLTDAGNLTISGTLTTGGPTCGAGCDRVFHADYDLPSINDHAAYMWENKHLPAVGPTVPHAPINLSEKYGQLLNELETAHIYIERLNKRIDALETALVTSN